ncbi:MULTISPECIES: alpha/beta fold hydrolase [unclassified Pseudomonas]|uniref:alpha/beta fold hydrolase n=1 Tax=unclassified Pseudomonas TaxID=196821 RepID=UPI0015877015|nr:MULTISPECIES: alpha/beta fold hydrolase [unclassified Pseudomonas]
MLICILAALGSTHAAASSPLANQSIQAGDSTWSYYEGAKNGPTLLLVHGFASSKEVWHALGETLTTRFHVIIPDLPGWGASTRIAQGNYDIDAQAARLDAFITALDIQGVTLVGHSMGGAIVGVYAAENPARVARLALIGSLGLSFAENDFIRTLTAGINPFIYDDRAGVERTARWVYLKPPALSDQQVDDAIAGNRAQRSFIESTLARIRIPSQWLALEPRLAQLTLPVLGVGCRQDKVIDISALDTLRNGLPTTQDTRLVTLEGCNHLPMIERPTETAQLLGDFILGTEAQTQRSTRQ